MQLEVTDARRSGQPVCTDLLDNVQQDLDAARHSQTLPDDYLDVTQGMLARLKRRIKQKLLHNFKTAYVDVLSRRQSAFNRQMLRAVTELAECCTLLDQAVQQLRQERLAHRKCKRGRGRKRKTAPDVNME
jgi:hypothetical protein